MNRDMNVDLTELSITLKQIHHSSSQVYINNKTLLSFLVCFPQGMKLLSFSLLFGRPVTCETIVTSPVDGVALSVYPIF